MEKQPEQGDGGLESERRQVDLLRRRLGRAWLSSLLVALAGLLSVWLMREEMVYFFHFGAPRDLGLAEELPDRPLPHNAYVSIRAVARDMCVRSEVFRRRVRFLYLMGSPAASRVIVESPATGESDCLGAEDRTIRGRLLALAATRRYRPVLAYYSENFPAAPEPSRAMVLREGVQPLGCWWAPSLAALLWGVWGLHLWLALRSRRRLRELVATGEERWDCTSTTP